MPEAVETYLHEMNNVRQTGAGTRETSFYPPLAGLLNALGDRLHPKVRAVTQLRNTGSGIPDGGLFAADQMRVPGFDEEPLSQMPARGALEIKPLGDDVEVIANSDQVRGYVEQYGQVLVTNYRDFLLVERGHQGDIRLSERITIASSERDSGKTPATRMPLPSVSVSS